MPATSSAATRAPKSSRQVTFTHDKPRRAGQEPAISARALDKVERAWRKTGVLEAPAACTTTGCRDKVNGFKAKELAGVTFSCKYACKYYKRNGVWVKVCTFKCDNGDGLTAIGTID
jgi:hypothetical protein